jgi:hypothetical protein
VRLASKVAPVRGGNGSGFHSPSRLYSFGLPVLIAVLSGLIPGGSIPRPKPAPKTLNDAGVRVSQNAPAPKPKAPAVTGKGKLAAPAK